MNEIKKIEDGMNAKERYDSKNIKRVTFAFNQKTESNLLKRLEEQENKARYIKNLIQQDIDSNK